MIKIPVYEEKLTFPIQSLGNYFQKGGTTIIRAALAPLLCPSERSQKKNALFREFYMKKSQILLGIAKGRRRHMAKRPSGDASGRQSTRSNRLGKILQAADSPRVWLRVAPRLGASLGFRRVHGGLDLVLVLAGQPSLVLKPGGSNDPGKRTALGIDEASIQHVKNIRKKGKRSWVNIYKAARALQDKDHEAFGTKNVERTSISVVRKIKRETGLSLVEIEVLAEYFKL